MLRNLLLGDAGQPDGPLFIDRHEAGELPPEDIHAAHLRDLRVQEKHHTRCLRYWMDQARGHVFCLADAPSKEAAQAVQAEGHGNSASAATRSEHERARRTL